MFTDGLKETTQDIICMNGVTAKGIRNIIDFAYSSSMDLDLGRLVGWLVGLWYLMPLSIIFQLYHGGGGSRSTQKKTQICRKSLTKFFT